jgi:CubicO group peptidase (beta-lactamase class C family)
MPCNSLLHLAMLMVPVVALLPSLCMAQNDKWVFPAKTWAVKTPAELGVDAARLEEFSRTVSGTGTVIKDGYLIYSWGRADRQFDWFSAAKPVLSTLLFCAIAEGRVRSVDDPIAAWGWPFRDKDQGITFRHLADMTSNYACKEGPGLAYSYNDRAINLYGKTLKKVFGASLIEVGESRLMKPLQFQDGRIFSSPEDHEGMRVVCTTRDFARIGWLWINRGRWSDRQLIPRELFDQYCKADVPSSMPRSASKKDEVDDYMDVSSYGGGINQTAEGPGVYGFNWWFNRNMDDPNKLTWPAAPSDTFIAYGRWGTDVMAMIPSLGLVVAADTEDSAGGTWGKFVTGDPNSVMNRNLGLLADSVRKSSAE